MIASNETLMTLEQAWQSPLLTSGRSGKGVPYSTIYRWVSRGVKGAVLETVVIGGIRFVSNDSITRFIQEATDARRYRPRAQGFTLRTPTKRRRDSEAAIKRLKPKGI